MNQAEREKWVLSIAEALGDPITEILDRMVIGADIPEDEAQVLVAEGLARALSRQNV